MTLLAVASAFALSSTVDAACSDVELEFARGTNEAPGLGLAGTPLLASLQTNLPGKTVSSYAVEYITQAAAACRSTLFVIGGYSRGASVTDIAIGVKTTLGCGETISTTLASRIKAVVTFGKPLDLQGLTIAKVSTLYGSKSIDDCNQGDPVCGAGFNVAAHLANGSDGNATAAGVKAAKFVLGTTRSPRGVDM